MSTVDLQPCCGNCRYSFLHEDDVHGTCHRHAPAPVVTGNGAQTWWPPITADLWCGEWKLPPTDDELFSDFLSTHGIPVLPPIPFDDSPRGPSTYEDPYEDPLA